MNDDKLQTGIVQAMQDAACYPHPTGRIQHVETHISHVLLTGDFAYKIKKPLNLGFLDFSTLDKRQHYCEEELRLNRRLAPDVYLEVVTLNGDASAPRINGKGPVLEYAVKMRQFDTQATLDRLDEKGQLTLSRIDALAALVARFHHGLPASPADSAWGTAETIWQPVQQNFEQIRSRAGDNAEAQTLVESLRQWSEQEHARLAGEFETRRGQGFVRECHGDLHLGNMAWENDAPLIFDCIEFNPALRWIDVMSEVAFCYMDLLHRGHRDFAGRFLNRYLEQSGDYEGVTLLRFYAVYRAMVRAKVAFIRAGQPGLSPAEQSRDTEQGLNYLRLAGRFTRRARPHLLITHGLSGSGKTTFSQELILQTGMISLRSDIERKRLAGLDALAKSGSGVQSGIYSQDFSQRTYDRLGRLAQDLLTAGWSVLVDATFIARPQREHFRQLAARCGAAFNILDFDVPAAELQRRIRSRSQAGNDASEADIGVLEHQLKTREPLDANEREVAIPARSIAEVLLRLGLAQA